MTGSLTAAGDAPAVPSACGAGGNAVIKRSVRIAGHPTSVSLEDVFWDALRSIAVARGLSLNALVSEIDAGRGDASVGNLSSAVRVYALEWFRRRAAGDFPSGLVPSPAPR